MKSKKGYLYLKWPQQNVRMFSLFKKKKLDIWFIYIANVTLFPSFPPGNTLSHPPSPCFYDGAHPPTHSLLPPCPGILLHWGIKPSQDQGPLLPLMSYKAILSYIYGWSHGSLHMYSLVGGLVSGSSGRPGWLIWLFLWAAFLDKFSTCIITYSIVFYHTSILLPFLTNKIFDGNSY